MIFFKFWGYFTLLFLFQAAIPMLSCAQSIDFGHYHALLIANKKYTHWKQLKTPRQDVYDLAEVLKNKYGFAKADIDILLDATRNDIIDKLEELKSTLTSRDNLLIYYAGHGKMREDGGYLIGSDAKIKSRSRWLHFRTILDLIDYKNGMEARHVLIIADSCHAGKIFSRGNDDSAQKNNNETNSAWLFRMNKYVSRTALTSGGIEEVIDSVGNSRNSIFAWELINRLKNNDKVLDMRTLYDQINKEVHDRARNAVGEEAQAPEYAPLRGIGHSSGDFIFVPKGMIMEPPRDKNTQGSEVTDRGWPDVISIAPMPPKDNSVAMWSNVVNRKMNWNEAKAYCKSYNGSGQSNWRLPTLEELKIANKNALGVTDQEVWAEKNNQPAYFNFEFGEGKSKVGSNYPHHVLCIAD
ncbi:MAG: caspase family protein [Candidatus Electrothrix aestuarii]|uniref:Caspase family protein n=1 Tax=Candidatus Electrothrix aestuarii TaxID=3062594 RepID=A0AAU8LP59_9BACT|nr:caspase family protein [Candidatus Electrothrix aestuarii]